MQINSGIPTRQTVQNGLKDNSLDQYHLQLKTFASKIMKITSKYVLSISGINMVKSILFKHIELMVICQSHSFEIFVSFTNLMRFYTYVITNVFMDRGVYDLLMNDIIMLGEYSQSNASHPTNMDIPQMMFSSLQKTKTNKLIQFQDLFNPLKQELIDMQLFADSQNS